MQSRMASAAKGTFGDRADSRAYAGTKDEDLQEVVKWFHGAYQHFMYTVQTNESGTEYQKQLNRELHKCNSFLSICEERAYTLAVTVLRNEQEREDDRVKEVSPHDPNQNIALFDTFIRSIKASLGPKDTLVHWLSMHSEVQLRSATPEGLDSFIAQITNYVLRVVRVQSELADNLRNSVTASVVGHSLYSAAHTPGGAGNSFDVHAVSLNNGNAGVLQSVQKSIRQQKARKAREAPPRVKCPTSTCGGGRRG